jgi:hypothetical protein
MIGTRLAHYEITSHLGSGGMGEVYQAGIKPAPTCLALHKQLLEQNGFPIKTILSHLIN